MRKYAIVSHFPVENRPSGSTQDGFIFSIWRPDPEDMGVKHYTLGYNGKYFESRINIWPQPFLISWQAFDDYLAEHLAYDDCHSCIKFFKDRCCQSRHKLT